jgi:hypothetical protein
MGDWIELFGPGSADLRGWRGRSGPHTWHVVGGVTLAPEDQRGFVATPGQGVLINSERGRTADIHTELEHGDCELHVEYCVPKGSNSGVYLMGQYEIQVLDSWGTPDSELAYGTNGGIYARHNHPVTHKDYGGHPPRVNASRKPGEWQELDVRFRAPRFDAAGRKTANACFERVVLNGQVLHENAECELPTGGAWHDLDVPRGPLRFQGDHGAVAYRNVRIRPLD